MSEPHERVARVCLGDRWVGEGEPCYVVAEIGTNFNGDLNLARDTIAEAARCGADAVKFQTFRAEEFLADRTLSYTYRNAGGEEVTETQYAMFKRLELPTEWHPVLSDHARACGVDFLSSTADRAAVDLLDCLGAPALKLASEDLINVALLEYVATKNRPVILSTGMADFREMRQAVSLFRDRGRHDLILLHCVSAYPTPPESCNLRKIPALRERFGLPVGFSDHTIGCDAAVVAVALGACLVEKHFTIDPALPGPDHAMSAGPTSFREMVEHIRLTEKLLGRDALTFDPIEENGRAAFRRSIVAARAIKAGELIAEDLLSYKRPGHGLKPYQRDQLVGKRARRDIPADNCIALDDVE